MSGTIAQLDQLLASLAGRLDQALAHLDRGDPMRCRMDLLVARNGLRALIEPVPDAPDTMSGTAKHAA